MPFGGSGAAPAGLNTSPMTGFFNSGAFSPRANGGSVSGNRPYLVGERGPELFVPGAQGNIVSNDAMGSTSVVVNVDASGTEVQGNQGNADQLGRLIGQAVQAELIKQKRPGGLLTR
jgi:phage-related minor tail protein